MERAIVNAEFWRSRRVLVTGAFGFLAGHLIEALVNIGAEVIAMYRDCPASSYLQMQGLNDRVTLTPGNINQSADCERVVNEHDCSVVFHLAAQAIVGAANRSPLGTLQTNIMGTCNVLEACRQLNSSDRTELIEAIVVASSDKAYGDQPELPYKESAPLLGMHPYDASKSCADLLTRMYCNTYKLPTAVTRCGNLYGPGDMNMSRIVPDTFRAIVQGHNPVIRSDGKPMRDYIYVKDAAEAYMVIAQATAEGIARGQAYNIGTGRPLSVLELVEKMIAASGRVDLKADVQGTSWGEISHQYLDSARANQELGWTPKRTVEDALEETFVWYRDYLANQSKAGVSR